MIENREKPQESHLYIGDSPSDVGACHEVGIPIVGVACTETTDSEKLQKEEPLLLF